MDETELGTNLLNCKDNWSPRVIANLGNYEI